MAKKQERVPGMREPKLNREQRRHPERVEDEALTRDAPDRPAPPPQDAYRDGPQDVTSTRAKSSGHKKKTADNWNQ